MNSFLDQLGKKKIRTSFNRVNSQFRLKKWLDRVKVFFWEISS